MQILSVLTIALTLAACSAGPQQTTAPSGSNSTTHGAPKTGMSSGADSGMR